MAKKVTLLNQSFGIFFEIEGRNITLKDDMKVQDAEVIAGLYPGVYVEVTDTEENKPAKATTPAKAE